MSQRPERAQKQCAGALYILEKRLAGYFLVFFLHLHGLCDLVPCFLLFYQVAQIRSFPHESVGRRGKGRMGLETVS